MGIKCPKCQFDNPDDSKFCKECGTQIIPLEEIPPSHTKTLETSKEEFTRGTTFAERYEFIEELGTGGMGSVYKVFDKKIKEEVALKILKPEIADEKTIERFSSELKLARKIRHENVCQMYDINEEEGTHYITMEYVPGEDLKSFIRRVGQLPVGKAISIAKQACQGLSEAHRLGTVHRDLKPQNIMIDKGGNARIMDFGIARSIKGKGITGAGMMIGTPEYMSPEQVEGKEVDQRSDIYSLGVNLYEMVTGQVPFEGDTPFTIGVKHKSEAPQNPKELNSQIPEEFSHLILKCMEKKKEKRYQETEEVISEFGQIEKGISTRERVAVGKKREAEAISEKRWENSIAVLPFTNMSADKEQEYFCDGMTEEIINALTNVESLRVVARTSAFAFKGKNVNVREIGRELNVESVLEGSVRKAGNRIRITAQLINVTDGYHLWAERYDREMKDVFAIQDEISLAIVDKLKVKLLEDEKAKIVKRFTEDLEAYNLYLKGRYFWNIRHELGLQTGMECFKQAIEKDPLYAFPYTGLADSYNILGYYGFFPPKETFPKAQAAARKALEIDNSIAEAHASLGYSSAFYDWDWAVAENELKHAIELNPSYATAHHWYAIYLLVMGRFDEAIEESIRGHELDPHSLIINVMVGLSYYGARQYDEAIEQYSKTVEMDPNFSITYYFMGMPYIAKKMWKESIATYQKFLQLSGGSPLAVCFLGLSYASSGQKSEAVKMLNQLNKVSKLRYVSPLYKGLIYVGLGQNNKALKHIEEAFAEREPLLAYLKVDPIFDNLRSESRFKALLKKMNFY